ncbi:hypothetical protein SO802_023872 [Lithocarpus litseifolius]|uniref:Uncharacterized protein n=1 Tax=Lithocarpus litseifolius TaxID=425828 RepID=A0AAW2CAK0_9ROSI
MALSATSLVFEVQRCEPELVAPVKPTPHEFKQLCGVDDLFREQYPFIMFCRYDVSMEGRDPVKVIREALAQTLVFYYPLAGRLREGTDIKFIIECTGEGVMFIEADGDVTMEEFAISDAPHPRTGDQGVMSIEVDNAVTLEKFGDALHPPFPCEEELLYEVPDSGGLLNCPLLLIQVLLLAIGTTINGSLILVTFLVFDVGEGESPDI